MAVYVSYARTQIGCSLEHVCNQIFERVTVETRRLTKRVILPKEVCAVIGNQLVMWVIKLSTAKRCAARV